MHIKYPTTVLSKNSMFALPMVSGIDMTQLAFSPSIEIFLAIQHNTLSRENRFSMFSMFVTSWCFPSKVPTDYAEEYYGPCNIWLIEFYEMSMDLPPKK